MACRTSLGLSGACQRMNAKVDPALKRLLDLVGAGVGLILLSPVFLVIAVIIKRTDRGPVLFWQQRIGRNGTPFHMAKFRSMRSNAEQVLRSSPELWATYVRNDFKLPEGQDPRITPVGRWLRKTSLDELPQLWNVLVGDMSLVGPRPLIGREIDAWYGDKAAVLLSVRPGMTGLWQVNGRSSINYPDRAQLELRYVRSRSLWGDLCIIAKTFGAVLKRQGAF